MPDEHKVRAINRLLASLGRIVHSMHKHGLVHRDLKSENVMLRHAEQGLLLGDLPQLWVVDFGMAGELGEAAFLPGGTVGHMAADFLTSSNKACVEADDW